MDTAALDFKLMIGPPGDGGTPVRVLSSPAGETSATATLPVDDEAAIASRLADLYAAVLAGAWPGADGPEETPVTAFGAELFDAVFDGEVGSLLDRSRDEAGRTGSRLRIQLHIDSPLIAALPWEFLYDEGRGEYLGLSALTPVSRYVELSEPQKPVAVPAPLRLLAMVASPSDLPRLDVDEERRRMEEALAPLVKAGQVELRWLEGQTWRHLQDALRDETWHAFHFVGHGAFDENVGQGMLALCDDNGATHRLSAKQLGLLFGDHRSLRLAWLNACEGARAGHLDLFSSMATVLVRKGTPAVVAMQYAVTDLAAIELSRTFYAALVSGQPVDAALGEARKAVAVGLPGSLEWGTPVLYLRAPDGLIFDIQEPATTVPPAFLAPPPPPPAESSAAPAVAAPAASAGGDTTTRDDVARTTGYLAANINAYRCAFGYAGLSAPGQKREGDGRVPGGKFPLRQVLYRADRMSPPTTRLPVRALEAGMAWCDDVACPDYNRLVMTPHDGGFEELWREDHIYDLLAVVGYNDDPVVPGNGSAIFVHIARPGFAPTVGCIGLALKDLIELLEHIAIDDRVEARSHPDLPATPAL